jgi:sec-independent protein translocase protein TatB
MFNFDFGELFVVALVALVVIGPKDLPRVLRYVGNWVGKARRVATQFRNGFDEMVRQSELDDLEKKWAAENERIMQLHPPEKYDSEPPPPVMTELPALADEAPAKKAPPKKRAPKKAAKSA